MARTHRCIDCRLNVEHDELELCPSCGKCKDHCDELGHDHMQPMEPPDA